MLKKITTLALTSLLAINASAESLWWGYGDGQNVSGGIGAASSATWTAAIKMPRNIVDSYAGSTISAVRFAVYGNNQSVKDCSYFITTDITSIQHPVSVGNLSMGWHEYQLAEPVTIEAGQDLYIGYICTGVYPIALVDGEGGEGTCVAGSGTNFDDYGTIDGYNWVLGIQAQLTNEHFPASLLWQGIKEVKVESDKDCPVRFDLQTGTPTAVTSFDAELRVNDEVVSSQHVECDLHDVGAATSVSFDLPAQAIGSYQYSVSVSAINGETLSAPVTAGGTLTVVKYLILRKQVIEECTGTWCGWCIRGLVGMQEMRTKYPDSFIGIAVHGSDSYSTSTYNGLLNRISGYPSAFINREKSIGTNPSEMEAAFRAEDPTADGEVKIVEARFTDASHSKLDVKVRTRFAQDYNTESYRLAFVVIEDYLRASQANYYSGGSYGPMGGFENQGSYVQVDLMDVARDIRNYTGLQGSVPSQITAGEVYEYTYTYTLPSTIKDLDNVSIVALLQNKNGSKIINADKCETLVEWDAEVEGIQSVEADASENTMIYNLMGQPMSLPAAGTFYIQNGKLKVNR